MVCHVFLCLALHIPVCPPNLRIQHDPTEANGSALGGACEAIAGPAWAKSRLIIRHGAPQPRHATAQVAEGFSCNPEHPLTRTDPV